MFLFFPALNSFVLRLWCPASFSHAIHLCTPVLTNNLTQLTGYDRVLGALCNALCLYLCSSDKENVSEEEKQDHEGTEHEGKDDLETEVRSGKGLQEVRGGSAGGPGRVCRRSGEGP